MENVHVGLADLELGAECLDLGEGIELRAVYTHLFAPFMAAFKRPEHGGSHPGPWKAARGGFAFDITTELFVPAELEARFESKLDVVQTVVFLIRLGVEPSVRAPLISSTSFREMAETPDNQARLTPYEVEPRYFPLAAPNGPVRLESGQWLREQWRTVHELIGKSTTFELAVQALDGGQFVKNSALTLISLWGALEALFAPSPAELRFRVSSLIAAYLEEPGEKRYRRQQRLAKLYDMRSASAHGKPKHEVDDVLETFNVLREVLLKIISSASVPSGEELNERLFGARTE